MHRPLVTSGTGGWMCHCLTAKYFKREIKKNSIRAWKIAKCVYWLNSTLKVDFWAKMLLQTPQMLARLHRSTYGYITCLFVSRSWQHRWHIPYWRFMINTNSLSGDPLNLSAWESMLLHQCICPRKPAAHWSLCLPSSLHQSFWAEGRKICIFNAKWEAPLPNNLTTNQFLDTIVFSLFSQKKCLKKWMRQTRRVNVTVKIPPQMGILWIGVKAQNI